ncbi:MAG: hypothetical protein JXJ04_02865 [Spirochaetales bacterium]|nr:hypothetical protein [Spirochaetales bacterium]
MKQFKKNDVLVVDNRSDSYKPAIDVFPADNLPFSIVEFEAEENSAERLFKNSVFTGCGKYPSPEALMIEVPASGRNTLHLLSTIHADDESGSVPVILVRHTPKTHNRKSVRQYTKNI